MRDETVRKIYGFGAEDSFADRFSPASIESVLFYVMAVAAWAVERLHCEHRAELSERLEELVPHRPKWYRDKALGFMADMELDGDTDHYDTSGLSPADIADARVVKHAVAMESRDSSLLTIKVAGENGGARCPLAAEHERQLAAYISQVKDAGVRTALVNMEADRFDCTIDVYHNPMLHPDTVHADCMAAITTYIENLPFNGEYTNMALVDRLQEVDGVRVVELKRSAAQAADEATVTEIDARLTPKAGYFAPGCITINMKAYDEKS